MLESQPWRRFLPELPPPPFADPATVLGEALPALKPARRISVPEWAEEERQLSSATYQGRWSNSFAPYMTEPSGQVTSRKYGAVAFVGPARTAKSESLVLNTVGHGIACKPRDMLVVCQTQDSARQFSERKLAPMLRANPALASRHIFKIDEAQPGRRIAEQLIAQAHGFRRTTGETARADGGSELLFGCREIRRGRCSKQARDIGDALLPGVIVAGIGLGDGQRPGNQQAGQLVLALEMGQQPFLQGFDCQGQQILRTGTIEHQFSPSAL